MSVESARARFRRRERSLMNSTVTVVRDSGEATFDPETGISQAVSTVYTGDALIRMAAWEGSDVQAAQTEVRRRPWRVKVPHGTELQRNDRVTIDTSDNPTLVGKTLRITDFFGDDWAPSAPYFAEEIT